MSVIRTEFERTRWIEFVQAQALPLEVTSKAYLKSRSNEQNALLWAMYSPIAEHMGYDAEAVHEWMCGRMWGWRDIKVPKTPNNPNGLASVPIRSTTRDADGKRNVIDKATFSKFVEMVDRIAAQAGVFVPREMAA